jgi:hypothetical protein
MMKSQIAVVDDQPLIAGRIPATELSGIHHMTGSKLGAMWCEVMHNSPMWPINGQYQCRTCGRVYPVQWAGGQSYVPSVRSLSLALMVVMITMLPSHVQAAEVVVTNSADRAAMVFARYIAGLEQTRPWGVESVEIDASLPKLEGEARLRAIRRLSPEGKPEYQVLESVGDQTVKQQVIFRYLTSEAQAAEMPATAVAMTPANYRFSYKGVLKTPGGMIYAFAVKPRKKRAGLIKGELWLDGENGAVVRQSGYLVKSPSIFVKRITVSRENSVRDGAAEERTTYVSVDLRLVGGAKLTIHESPCFDSDCSPALSMNGQ